MSDLVARVSAVMLRLQAEPASQFNTDCEVVLDDCRKALRQAAAEGQGKCAMGVYCREHNFIHGAEAVLRQAAAKEQVIPVSTCYTTEDYITAAKKAEAKAVGEPDVQLADEGFVLAALLYQAAADGEGYDALRAACMDLYLAGRWSCADVSDGRATALWTQLRDAAEIATYVVARCEGRIPVGQQRDEPFAVTYRCGLSVGHQGPHATEPTPPPAAAGPKRCGEGPCKHFNNGPSCAAQACGWYRAIDEASVLWDIAVEPTDDPKAALHELLCREQAVALDPAVSSCAKALQDAARPPRCGTCRHFQSGYSVVTGWCIVERKGGVDMHAGIPVPADGSGFCHLHEEAK